ncbi:MAG: cytochrome c oxidase subunit 3 [Bryobacterales bacterium]|nr:cytochrome c oxidase subunit 3 [Bryobacterales bacterium]
MSAALGAVLTSHKKLGMWLFLVSDALTFTTLILCYAYVRIGSPTWPAPFDFSPGILFSTLMTFVLLTSSLTMVIAVDAMRKGDRRRTALWIAATILCGAAFIALHMTEWRHLMAEGVTLTANPWGVPLFGAAFFGLTGLHMAHVASGIVYLGVLGTGVRLGRFTTEDVEVGGLYWHFVDLVWMFLFPLLYLTAVKP